MTEKQKIKNRLVHILKRNGIARAALFGSLVTGPFNRNSDIDLLIEFKGKKSLIDLAGLKIRLEDALGRKVDLLTFKALHPLLKARILAEKEELL